MRAGETAGDQRAANAPAAATHTLTEREIEIVRLLCEALTSKQIAERLNLGVRTIDVYRYQIGKKTGCGTGARLGIWAERRGLVGDIHVEL